MKQLKTNVAIIGSGAAGMAMALYLKRANIDFLLFEKDTPGGKLNQLSNITNYLGIKKIDGPSLAFSMFDQISKLGVDVFGEEILSIQHTDNGFLLTSSEDSKIECKFVVIATGMIMSKLNVKGYDIFLKKGISSCAVCDGYLYKNKPIAVVGDSSLACKEYIYLKGLSDVVYSIDNDEEKVLEFIGHERLEKIITNKNEYDVSAAFVYTPESINLNLIKNLKVETIDGRIKVDDNFMTSEDKVYAIGDACHKKIYQIVGAVNDASVASVSIIKNITNGSK